MSDEITLENGVTVVSFDGGPVPVSPALTPTQARALADGQPVVVVGGNTGGGGAGSEGPAGADGASAYELAVAAGFVGTEAEWLLSLEGTDGVDGQDGAPGVRGPDGFSAYEVAVMNGFIGTETDWLASLDGADGAPGVDGSDGAPGLSAYEVAVAAGFVGTEADWLASLHGTDGVDGQDGTPGADGATGAAATVAVGQTLTGEPGTPASVVNVGTGTDAVFDFTIPRGADGAAGSGGGGTATSPDFTMPVPRACQVGGPRSFTHQAPFMVAPVSSQLSTSGTHLRPVRYDKTWTIDQISIDARDTNAVAALVSISVADPVTGEPGPVTPVNAFSFEVTLNPAREVMISKDAGAPAGLLTVALETPFTFEAGTLYWIGISNQHSGGNGFNLSVSRPFPIPGTRDSSPINPPTVLYVSRGHSDGTMVGLRGGAYHLTSNTPIIILWRKPA